MKRSSTVLGLVVPALVVACSGDPGPQGEPGPPGAGAPSVSAIVPGRAYLARKVDVTISGSGTNWDGATKVDFGAGITVDKVTIASPTAIVASLTVTPVAAVGARDVTVTAGDVVSTYKGAFGVESPLGLSIKGTAAQGSVFFVSAQGRDLSTPFDTTAESSLFSAPTFKGITIGDLNGAVVQVQDVSLYKTELVVIADVTAPAGVQPLSLESGVEGSDKVPFPYPQGLELAARTATPLTVGTPATQTVAKPFDSQLFSFMPPAGLGVVDVTLTTSDAAFAPAAIVLPKSGKFAEALTGFAASSAFLASAAEPLYVVALDTSGAVGKYSLSAKVTAATGATEAADNDTLGAAQVLGTLPAVVTNGALSSASDEDWYRVTATAGDVGKKLRVLTSPGDRQADPVVEVFASDGTTPVGEATDDSFHESFVSPAITAEGTYFIKITHSTQSPYSAAGSRYQLVVRFE